MSKLVWESFSLDSGENFSFFDVLSQDGISDKFFICINGNVDKRSFNKFKDAIYEIYFNSIEKNLKKDEVFEETIKEINAAFSSKFHGLNSIVGLYAGSSLYVTQSGEAECYLIRNGRVSVICESVSLMEGEDSSEEGQKDLFVDIASGNLINDDILVFSSKRLLKNFTSDKLVSMFTGVLEGVNYVGDYYTREKEANSLISVHVQKESVFSRNESGGFSKIGKNIFDGSLAFTQGFVDKTVGFVANRTNYSYEAIQRSLVALLGVITVVFFISIIAFSSSIQNSKEKATYEKSKIEILKIDKLLEVAESRALMQSSDEANQILDEIEKTTNSILDEGLFRQDALLILEKVQKMRDNINKITRIIKPEQKLLFDLNTISNGIKIKGFVVLEGAYFAYSENKFYKVVLNKFEKEYSFPQDEKIRIANVMNDKKRIVVISDRNTFYEFDGNEFQKVTTSDEFGWKTFIDAKTYSKFIYLLDNGLNGVVSSGSGAKSASGAIKVGQVWKYSKGKSGYQNASAYTKGIDFSDALSIAIDGSVYVLKKDGIVVQFYSGKEVGFSYDGPEIKDATYIFTDVDYLHLFFLDTKANKIVMLEKSREGAKLKKQIVFENVKINGFYVFRDEKEILILGDSKFYKLPL